MAAEIEDTYAEAFRSIYAQVLVTAVNRTWLDHAAQAATGHASSSILCDCEAGVDRYVGPGGDESYRTPDGRPGVILQFHLPRFKKDREATLEKVLLARLSQNILTCPTTACFNLIESDPYFKLGGRSRCLEMAGSIARNASAGRCGPFRSCRESLFLIAALDSGTGSWGQPVVHGRDPAGGPGSR